MRRPSAAPRPAGSCIAVVATDAPLHPAQLERVARRAGLGLARTGSVAHHGSGEIFLAFSTARGGDRLADDELDPLFAATVDATEEAVVNALWSAERVVGREGRVVDALPHEEVVALLEEHRRAAEPAVLGLDEVGANSPHATPPGRVQSHAPTRSKAAGSDTGGALAPVRALRRPS